MNVKTVKKPKRRIDIGYVSRFKMQAYGYDNLYPQNLARITEASGTAMLCLNRYARFIEGYGFDSDILAALAMNQQGDTADDLLRNVSGDLARFGGFALHVNYNVLGQVSSVSHVPFENCRLEETDDNGNVAHVLLHPDWEQKKTRNGKRLMVNEKTIERINTFNPDPDIVLEQIENAGGIDSYKGQILWQSLDGQFIYPTASYDSAITEISTDEGLGNVKMRNVRNNFLVSCMLVTKKGVPKFDENGKEVMEYEKNKKGLWRLISIIPALIAIIVFIFTEDMTLPMIFVDKWTILHVVIALVQVVVMVLCKKKKDENDEDENAANA